MRPGPRLLGRRRHARAALGVPPARPADLDELAEQAVLRRIEASFPNVYLNLISVIQGVAFGFLVSAVVGPTMRHSTEQWLRTGLCTILIVIVSQEYMVGATVFAWTPTLLDTLVPYGIGALEFAAVSSITGSLRTFLTITGLLWCAGLVAYGNLWYHARHGFPINRYSYRLFGGYIRFGITISVGGIGLSTAVLLTQAIGVWGSSEVWPTLTVEIPYIVLAVHSIWDWNLPSRAIKRRSPLDSGRPTGDF
jgi:hypothetical protein